MNKTLVDMKERRSFRAYTDKIPSEELLDAVIEAGLYAANGRGKQSPIIISVTDKKLRDRLSELNSKYCRTPMDDPFYGAPAVLAVLADREVPTAVYDGSLVMGNLMLAAHTLGLGSCWIHRALEVFDSNEGKEILHSLGIEGDYEGIGFCIIGYPANELPSPPARHSGRVFKV